ncbi:DUF389 domain-containing protein [Ilumatobacter sp.]|uniref:DUF389 domain-containing protein n=1 Tax=Ilumatobacter sp. TaxID=1967498 RepID=UPI003B52CACF
MTSGRGGASGPLEAGAEPRSEAREEKIDEARRRLEHQAPAGSERGDPAAPIRRDVRWWHRHLEPGERQRIMAELAIKRERTWGGRFAVMLSLSVVVAVMGLSADSAAVVIGAMLLAPLMQPVLAAAACISMALFKKAARSAGHVALATLGSIALSYLLAAAFVTGDLPNEVTSRTAPDIRDLVVALGAGTAGAYATVRKDASSSLAGVAVAVALVPPLGAVGISLQAGRGTLARGALLLYTTNLAAILLAASIVFVLTGFVPPRRLATTFRRTAVVAAAVAMVVGAITIPLYRASRSAVEATDRQLEASRIVGEWLGDIETTEPPRIAFDGDRVLVRVRSFEFPPDDTPRTVALGDAFGPERQLSLEWDRFDRPTTTVAAELADEERRFERVEAIVREWLGTGRSDGTGRLDALVIDDADVIRVDASGVGSPPSMSELTDRLDDAFDRALEVQLTWLERESVGRSSDPSPDALLAGRVEVLADAWAEREGVTVAATSVDRTSAVVEVVGAQAPDASDLVDEIDALLGEGASVSVLYVERIDITRQPGPTTTTAAATTPTTTPTGSGAGEPTG